MRISLYFCQKLTHTFKAIQTVDSGVDTNSVFYSGLLKQAIEANLTLNIFEPKRKKLELFKECKLVKSGNKHIMENR